jgi:hypothetical protein
MKGNDKMKEWINEETMAIAVLYEDNLDLKERLLEKLRVPHNRNARRKRIAQHLKKIFDWYFVVSTSISPQINAVNEKLKQGVKERIDWDSLSVYFIQRQESGKYNTIDGYRDDHVVAFADELTIYGTVRGGYL